MYNMCVIMAYRQTPANKITSAEYTGLVWAVLFGWWLFGEQPDLWFAAGAVMISAPLILLGMRGNSEPRKQRRKMATERD
ncbi:DMT family transporter [Alkalilimnicola ehrlichii]|uniref:DMT family transporter n=1 Tax=Alkalilimnicola ehrlichii TaxID=351052 RepID=UPI001C6E1798|nr:DMT family transporter [Alkalilimnicola ehrlichii]